MRVRTLVGAAAMAFCLGVSSVAGALPTVGDNTLTDWGVTIPGAPDGTRTDAQAQAIHGHSHPGDNGAPYNDSADWAPDGSLAGVEWDGATYDGVVAPGVGSQAFDVEVFYSYFDESTDNFYFAMVTGFNPEGAQGFEAGDLFFNFTGGAGYDLAVRVADPAASPSFGDAYYTNPAGALPTSHVFYAQHQAEASPYRTLNGNLGVITDTTLVTADWFQSGSHYVLELCFQLTADQLQYFRGDPQVAGDGNGTSVHWTMECGNDFGNWTVPPPVRVVPEPATLTLLGLGLAGLALRRRMR